MLLSSAASRSAASRSAATLFFHAASPASLMYAFVSLRIPTFALCRFSAHCPAPPPCGLVRWSVRAPFPARPPALLFLGHTSACDPPGASNPVTRRLPSRSAHHSAYPTHLSLSSVPSAHSPLPFPKHTNVVRRLSRSPLLFPSNLRCLGACPLFRPVLLTRVVALSTMPYAPGGVALPIAAPPFPAHCTLSTLCRSNAGRPCAYSAFLSVVCNGFEATASASGLFPFMSSSKHAPRTRLARPLHPSLRSTTAKRSACNISIVRALENARTTGMAVRAARRYGLEARRVAPLALRARDPNRAAPNGSGEPIVLPSVSSLGSAAHTSTLRRLSGGPDTRRRVTLQSAEPIPALTAGHLCVCNVAVPFRPFRSPVCTVPRDPQPRPHRAPCRHGTL